MGVIHIICDTLWGILDPLPCDIWWHITVPPPCVTWNFFNLLNIFFIWSYVWKPSSAKASLTCDKVWNAESKFLIFTDRGSGHKTRKHFTKNVTWHFLKLPLFHVLYGDTFLIILRVSHSIWMALNNSY